MYVGLLATRLAATQRPISEIGIAFGFPGQRRPFSALAESDGPESEVVPKRLAAASMLGQADDPQVCFELQKG